ncbi:MAG: TRAP transporter substrate-binding protein [Parvularculales bacterium]
MKKLPKKTTKPEASTPEVSKKTLKRRDVLTGITAGALAAPVLGAPAIAQGKRSLSMVTTWPKNFPGLGTGAERVAKNITTLTEGQLEVKVYSAGELVGAFESFDAVSNGSADMYHGAEYYWQGKSAAYAFFTTVPFGMTPFEAHAWVHSGGGQELWDELAAGFNLKPFLCGDTGTQWGGWFNREINSTEDMKGLKMRMPGLGGEVLRRIGATAVTLPGGELFAALQSGAIDAAEWSGPWNDLAFGFYKIAKHYYWPGWQESNGSICTVLNKDVWDSLTSAQQGIIKSVCNADTDYMMSEILYNNAVALETLVNKHGVQLKQYPDDVLGAIRTVSRDIISEVANKDPMAKKVHDSYMASLKKTDHYLRHSDAAFFSHRDI